MSVRSLVEQCILEDDIDRNYFYQKSLPCDLVKCLLYVKSDLMLVGLPYFVEVFNYLGSTRLWDDLLAYEGKTFLQKELRYFEFELPFNLAITGERTAINLLQHASSVASYTARFVEKAERMNIKILDTRKTTPCLRILEKYSVRMGGGFNHRMGPSDIWMIKDNHKNFFGGLHESIKFFKQMNSFYSPLILEVHSLDELEKALTLKVEHILLDNFTIGELEQALLMKSKDVTYEVSGGIGLHNLDSYLLKGVDAISVGSLTSAAPRVDFSLTIVKK